MFKKLKEKDMIYVKIKNFNRELESYKNRVDILELINAVSEIKNWLKEIFPYLLINTYWPKPLEFPILPLHGHVALPGQPGLPHDPATPEFRADPVRGLQDLLHHWCKSPFWLVGVCTFPSSTTVKPWVLSNLFCEYSARQQTFLINFNLINERCLAIWVVCYAKCQVIITEPMVLKIRFDIQVLWITSMFPELIMLTNQGFAVFWCHFLALSLKVPTRTKWLKFRKNSLKEAIPA